MSLQPPSEFPRFQELPTKLQAYIFDIAANKYNSRHCTSYYINWTVCNASDCDCNDSVSELTNYENHPSGNTYIQGLGRVFVSLYNGGGSLYYSFEAIEPMALTCWLARWIGLKQWKKVVDIVALEEVPMELSQQERNEVLVQKLKKDINDAERRLEGKKQALYPWFPPRRRRSWESC